MQQIRLGTFETNSSSTHAICMCTSGDYERWVNGDKSIVFDWSDGRLISFENAREKVLAKRKSRGYNPEITCALESMTDEELYKSLMEDSADFYSYETYQNRENNEADDTYFDKFVTPSGDVVVLFGYNGYDG